MRNQFYVIQISATSMKWMILKVSKNHKENIHYDTMCYTALKSNPAAKGMENAQ